MDGRNLGRNTFSIIDLATKSVAGEINLGGYHRPHGIEIGSSGKLYVTCDLPSAVLIIDPQSRKIERTIRYANQELPRMLTVIRDESKLYTANAGNGTVTS